MIIKQKIIVFFLLVFILSFGLIFGFFYRKNITENITQIPFFNSLFTDTNFVITLPIKNISMDYGIENCTFSLIMDPPQQKFSIPNTCINAVAAYGINSCNGETMYSFIGPKGWNGEGMQGGNGSLSIYLYPNETFDKTKSYIQLEETWSTSGAWPEAATFFPEAKITYEKTYNTILPTPTQKQITLERLTNKLILYTIPANANDLEIHGLAFYESQPHFLQLEVVLPSSQHDVSLSILHSFIQKQELDKK